MINKNNSVLIGHLAIDFDIVFLPDGAIRFAHFTGQRVLLSFYCGPACSICASRYLDCIQLPREVSEQLIIVAVFNGNKNNYSDVLIPNRHIIQLFDSAGSIGKMYGCNADEKLSVEVHATQNGCCLSSADFFIDEQFVIQKVNTTPINQRPSNLNEIIEFALKKPHPSRNY